MGRLSWRRRRGRGFSASITTAARAEGGSRGTNAPPRRAAGVLAGPLLATSPSLQNEDGQCVRTIDGQSRVPGLHAIAASTAAVSRPAVRPQGPDAIDY